jgi:hypothetical protein
MNQEMLASIPVWLLLAAGFGLMIGWTCGDEVRRRIHAEDRINELQHEINILQEQHRSFQQPAAEPVSKGVSKPAE